MHGVGDGDGDGEGYDGWRWTDNKYLAGGRRLDFSHLHVAMIWREGDDLRRLDFSHLHVAMIWREGDHSTSCTDTWQRFGGALTRIRRIYNISQQLL